MEWITDKTEIRDSLKKYRWVILILAVGVLLMLFPGEKTPRQPQTPILAEKMESSPPLEDQLEQILSQLEGAGKVRVLLTESAGQQTVYQTDRNDRKTAESEEVRRDTVILTEADRDQAGLVSRVDPPKYLGAVVLCQGADKASVRLAIVDAVSTATGLGADKISVWKMK